MAASAPVRSSRPKTANKTAKPSGRNGNVLPIAVGSHGGGKKGVSGRKPASWGLFIAELRESDTRFRDAIRRAAYDDEGRNFGHVLKLVRDYDPDAPEKKLAVQVEVLGVIAMPLVAAPSPPADAIARAERAEIVPPLPPALARLQAMAPR